MSDTNQSGAAADLKEMENLWAEMNREEEGPKGAGADKPSTGEVISDEFSTENKEGGKDAATEGTAGAGKDAEEAKKPDTNLPEVIAKAPPEVQAAFTAEVDAARRKADNDARAAHGRQVKKMRDQLEALKASGEGPGPSASKAVDSVKDLTADYPEIAKPLESAIGLIEQRIERLDTSEKARNNDRFAEIASHVQSQHEILDAKYPAWDQTYTAGKPLHADFVKWLDDQPKRLRDIAYQTNRDHIMDGIGAVEVFDAFEASRAAPSPSAEPGRQTQELSSKRAAQLDGSSTPANPGRAPIVSGVPKNVDDPEAHWNALKADDPDEDAYRPKRRA